MNSKTRSKDEIVNEIRLKRTKYKELQSDQKKFETEILKLKYESNEFHYINQFPVIVMNSILKHLDINEIINFERVCQKWSEYVNEFKIDKLVITKNNDRTPKRWCQSNELCDPKLILVKSDLKFESDLKSSFISNLKQLKILNEIDDLRSDKIKNQPLLTDLKLINQLTKLEVLEISKLHFEQEETISLPNLKYLTIQHLYSKLKLNTPKLSKFEMKSINDQIKFIFPEMLNELHLNELDDCSDLDKFKNLEHFYLNKFTDLNNLNEVFIQNHSNLKLISIRPDFKYFIQFRYDKFNIVDDIKKSCSKILELKNQFKKSDLKLIFCGIQIEDVCQFENYEYGDENLVELHIENYSKLCKKELKWITQLNYSSLIQCSNGQHDQIPDDFNQLFDQIEEVLINDEFDEDDLINFLKGFKNFGSFKIKNEIDLTNSFYEKLSTNFPSIWSLSIEDEDSGNEIEECEFVSKFDNLYRFYTNKSENDVLIDKCFDKFETFEITFSINNSIATVKKEGRSKFELIVKDDYDFSESFRSDYHDLSDLFEELNLKFGD